MPSPKPFEGAAANLTSASAISPVLSCALPPPSSASTNLPHDLAPATVALHADDHLHSSTSSSDVAPPIHVSTNFSAPADPEKLIPARELLSSPPLPTTVPVIHPHVYSRESSPNTTRLEAVLSGLLGGSCVTYSSGLAALHAAYVFLRPRRVAIGQAYFGSHGVVRIHHAIAGAKILPLDCAATDLHPGDVIHLETPVNPFGLALDIGAYARKAHSRGAYLLVDATFGPPGLQDPFQHGADLVFHSGTKYLGGHGDLLCGVLVRLPDGQRQIPGNSNSTGTETDWIAGLKAQRVHLGSIMGSLEAWLAVRSLRTLTLRVRQQSNTAGKLVRWLHDSLQPNNNNNNNNNDNVIRRVLSKIHHASLQPEASDPNSWLCAQMPNGYGPVFAITMRNEGFARRFPSYLKLWRHATSLGGVESLIDWRALHDPQADGRLLRLSVGVEDFEDLRKDLEAGFVGLVGGDEGGEGEEAKGTARKSKL